ncbi:MAG: alanine--tRNA ligase [Candidatus Izemoplasmatales bacterium]|jgi:alanyl-tRNA synthetase
MKYLTGNQIRQMWLDFFQSKGHSVEQGASLVPNDDPTLLWMNAGVAALKKYFDGSIVPKNPRIVNAQKCIRTNDIENVGKTARHHTFFEMLGNFSIGDYFRKEAIMWGFELLTDPRWFGFDKNRLYMTVYFDDQESADQWIACGIDPSHVIPTKDANFWEIGEGPCGPCTEIFFDRGEKYGSIGPEAIRDDIENERYIEIWNIVLSQFNAKPGLLRSDYPELPKKNIDTGCGLERIATVIQEVKTNYDTDLFIPIMDKISAISGVKYEGQMAFKVIADHIRTVTFAIADGALLSNEGRGYVLRRLLRRAVKYGRQLGINRPFMSELVEVVGKIMHGYYPNVVEQTPIIKKIISAEETKFLETLVAGEKKFQIIAQDSINHVISGADAFLLYDTFGFPIELTIEYAEELGLSVDTNAFLIEMEKQKDRARNARKDVQSMKSQNEEYLLFTEPSEFVGYDTLTNQTKIIKVFSEGLVLEKTPFYATSGGQVADVGMIYNDRFSVEVTDVSKLPNGQFIHRYHVLNGKVVEGAQVFAQVFSQRRDLTTYNHSATHLLFKALRDLLGNHVSQQGSQVTSEMLRFDFNHFAPITDEQILKLETMVNEMIRDSYVTTTTILPVDEAVSLGAVAEFGEKYGDFVRTVDLKYTLDLCGGTHVRNLKDIGSFAIKSISSIGSGIYRIEALTNINVPKIVSSLTGINQEITNLLHKADIIVKEAKTEGVDVTFAFPIKESVIGSYQDVIDKHHEFTNLQKAVRDLEKEVTLRKEEKALEAMDQYYSLIKDNRFIERIDNLDSSTAKQLADNLYVRTNQGLIFIATVKDEKVTFTAKCGDATINCGKLVKEAAQMCGGNGGGRPDFAQAGGKDLSKVNDALAMVKRNVI